jgi:ribosomal protein S18 acetylase RimI-like enzyme
VPDRIEIAEFSAEHLEAAGKLAAARNARMREAESGLSASWSDPSRTRASLEERITDPLVHGVAALRGSSLVGYLLGTEMRGGRFGNAAWAELGDHALDQGVDADLARDLYAAWAPIFVERGLGAHMVQVVDLDHDLLWAWFELGFGQMHAYALRETSVDDLPPNEGIRIRRASLDDRDVVIGQFATLISRHQAATPSFTPNPRQRAEQDEADWLEELSGPEAIWLAADAATGDPLGLSISYPPDPGPAVPEHAIYLGATSTLPAARGRGVARALLRHVLETARSAGMTHCTTNWRTSNLEASRVWPRLGFRRTHLRLRRDIDRLLGGEG